MGTLAAGIKDIFSTAKTTGTNVMLSGNDGTPDGHISMANLASILGVPQGIGNTTAYNIKQATDFEIPNSRFGGILVWYFKGSSASGTFIIPYYSVFTQKLFNYGSVDTNVFRATAGTNVKIGSNGTGRDILYIFIPFNNSLH